MYKEIKGEQIPHKISKALLKRQLKKGADCERVNRSFHFGEYNFVCTQGLN